MALPPSPPLAPPLIGRLTLIAERLLPVLAHVTKTHRMTVAHTTWVSLHQTTVAVFAAVTEADNAAHRIAASAAFDTFKWNLRLMEQQRLVSPGWSATISGDLAEVGRMIGGMVRKTRAF
jgi:hypothetical protein